MSMYALNRVLAALVAPVLALWVAGCSGGSSEGEGGSNEPEPIVIGAIFDLTGATSDVGVTYAEGMKDHISWRNANGGIEGRPITLRSADYGYRVDNAERLYTQYVADGAVVFFGWGTGDTEALRGRIARDKVPFMSASYSTGLLDMEQAPYNFLVGTSYTDQALISLRWAKQDHEAKEGAEGPTKVAIVHHDSPFGTSPLEEARAYAEKHGIELTSIAMPKGATDFVAELARIQQAGADYVIIHNTAGPASVMVKDARTQGLDLTFIGLVWVADEIFLRLTGEAAEGVVGAMPFAIPTADLPGAKNAAAYLEKKGESLQEKGLHYTQGWWTVGVMLEGVERALKTGEPLTGESVKKALETLDDYETGGITAPITFSGESHRGNDSLRMHRVQGGAWVAIGDLMSAGG